MKIEEREDLAEKLRKIMGLMPKKNQTKKEKKIFKKKEDEIRERIRKMMGLKP